MRIDLFDMRYGLFILIVILIGLTSCAKINPDIDWSKVDRWDYASINDPYVSSPVMVEKYNEVKSCLGLDEVEIPFPAVTFFRNEVVPCGDRNEPYCYENKRVFVPTKTSVEALKTGYIHYLLDVSTGNPDLARSNPLFPVCSKD